MLKAFDELTEYKDKLKGKCEVFTKEHDELKDEILKLTENNKSQMEESEQKVLNLEKANEQLEK